MKPLPKRVSFLVASIIGPALAFSAHAAPDDAAARALQAASGEARTDLLSIAVIGFIAVWFVIGLIGTVRWNRTEIWFWPLFFLRRGERGGSTDAAKGRDSSFGGGGASGGW